MAKLPNPITTAVKFVRRNRYKVSTAVLSMESFSQPGFVCLADHGHNEFRNRHHPRTGNWRETILIDTLTDLSAFMSGKADRKLRTIVGTTDARAYIAEYLKQRLDRMGTLSKGGEAIPAFQLELANAWSTYADVLGASPPTLDGLRKHSRHWNKRSSFGKRSSLPQPQDHTLALAELNQRWTQIKHDASLVQGRFPSEAEKS